MKLLDRLRKSGVDFIYWSKQKLPLVKVYGLYLLIIGVLYAGNAILDKNRNKTTAYLIAQNFVSAKLVSPESAQFPPKSDGEVYIEDLGHNRYRILGYVYSRNTFGYEKRSDYQCTVRNIGSGEWKSENVVFQ